LYYTSLHLEIMMKGLSFEDCSILDLERLYANAGWCGLEIFVMYDIGNDDGSYGNFSDDSLCGYWSHQLREPYLMLCSKLTVVLFRSTEHQNCGPQPGFVRAFIQSNVPCACGESYSSFVMFSALLILLYLPTISGGGFKISPIKCRNGRPRTQVQHLMQIDLKGWGMNYFPSFQYHSLLQMLN
jgi:hypothetical protein